MFQFCKKGHDAADCWQGSAKGYSARQVWNDMGIGKKIATTRHMQRLHIKQQGRPVTLTHVLWRTLCRAGWNCGTACSTPRALLCRSMERSEATRRAATSDQGWKSARQFCQVPAHLRGSRALATARAVTALQLRDFNKILRKGTGTFRGHSCVFDRGGSRVLKGCHAGTSFEQAIFRGRRRQGQTLTGFLAGMKAAFGELKKQGLDLLESSAGKL